MPPSNLLELVKKPNLARIEAWKRLTAGSALYAALVEAVQTNTIGPALEYVEEWRSFAEYRPEERWRWDMACKLVRCAEQAASYQEVFGDEPGRSCVRPLPSTAMSRDEEDSRVYVNTFINPSPVRSVQVPIAGWSVSGGGEGTGFTATLVLELLPGHGHIAQHPADLFSTAADDLFREAMEAAWAAARAHASVITDYDGRWRVVQDGYPLAAANGRSAGAAAALGWLHAFDSTALDESIIVLAQVDGSGKLEEVEGVPEKVRAVIECEDFDTILVAGEKNLQEALHELRQKNIKYNRVQALAVENLPAAYEKRSRLTDELIGYCRTVADDLDWVPWLSPSGECVKVSDIIVPVRVHAIRERTARQKAINAEIGDVSDPPKSVDLTKQTFYSAETPDSVTPSGQEIEPVPFAPRRRAATDVRSNSLFKQNESEMYEEGLTEAHGGQPWEEVWPQRGELIVIRAKPGGGKTVHTRQITVKAARELADRLEKRRVGLSKAERIPVWLTVVRIADQTLPPDTEAAIVGALERQFSTLRLSPALRDYLKRALHERAWLIFDGLDELYDAEQLSTVTRHFSTIRTWFSPCCVACRTGNYETETLARDRVVEYQLAPFRWNGSATHDNEIRRFVIKWFGAGSEKGAELLKILEQNFALRHQCSSPLLLTLTCLAHQNSSSITEWTTHADLFALVLNGLLSGKWRSRVLSRGQQGGDGQIEREDSRRDLERQAFNGLTLEDSRIDFAQDMLPHLAYLLVSKAGLRNRFLSSEVIEALYSVPETCRSREPRSMIEWLLYKGILVNAGYETGRICYSFVHRALLEYLVAQELKNRPDYIEAVTSGLVTPNELTANAWRAIVPPLVGSLKDPTQLVEALVAASQDDRLRNHWPVLSSAILTCLLESKSGLPEPAVKARAFDAVLMQVDYVQRNSKGNAWRLISARDVLHMAIDAARKHYGHDGAAGAIWEAVTVLKRTQPAPPAQRQTLINTLKEALGSNAAPVRWAALWALAAMKEGAAAVRGLSDESPVVRGLALRALAAARVNNAFELLVQGLSGDSPYERGSAAHALGELGDARAVPHLKRFTLGEGAADSITRESVMWALAALATINSDDLANVFRLGLRDDVDKIRKHAVTGLVNSANLREWPSLVELVRGDPSETVRQHAAWALGMMEIADGEAVNCLVQGMTDNAPNVAAACCGALIKYALDEAYPQILSMLARADDGQKNRLLYGLIGTVRVDYQTSKVRPKYYTRAAELCLKLLDDPSEQVKAGAGWALTTVMRLPGPRSDAELARRALGVALRLCDDPAPRTRTSGCSLLIELFRLNSNSLLKEESSSRPALTKTFSLLDDPHSAVRRKACMFLLEAAEAGATFLLKNGRMCERVVEVGLESFRESIPRHKADALDAFRYLFWSPRLLAHKRLRGEVMDWCLQLIELDSPDMRTAALLMLKTLMRGTIHPPEEQNVNLIIEKCFELVSNPDPPLQANALSLLTVIFTLPQYQTDRDGLGTLVSETLRLTYDEATETRTSACWSLAQVAASKPEALTANRPAATSIINRLTVLLSDHVPDVKAYALLAFKNLAATPLMAGDTQRLRYVANKATQMLKEKSDKVKAYALWTLGELLRAPVLRNNRRACDALAVECRRLLSNKTQNVRTNALHILEILRPKGAQGDGEQQHLDATRERLISLLDSPNPRAMERALQDLIDLIRQESFQLAAAPRFYRVVADRSLRALKNFPASVQVKALMVLQHLLTNTPLRNEAALQREVSERTLALLESSEPTLTATALQTLESLLVETDLKLDEDLKTRFYGVGLRLLEAPSFKVRTTALGIFVSFAKHDLLTQTLSEEVSKGLISRCLSMLGEIDKGMQASALMVLEQVITKTSLRDDTERGREAIKRCLELLSDAEDEVKAAALRTIETIILKTQLRNDAQLVSDWLAHSLSLLEDLSPRVKIAASGSISNVVTGRLLPVTADGQLESSLVEKLVSTLNEGHVQIISSVSWSLSKLLQWKWRPLISDQDALQKTADRCAELLNDPRLNARAGAGDVLSGILSIKSPALSAEATLAVAKRSLELLADASPKMRAPASAILAKLVINRFSPLISDEYLVKQMFERAKSLLRDSDSMVRANALKILQVIAYLPEHERQSSAHHRLAASALKSLSAQETHVRIGACSLLIEMIRLRLKVVVEDDNLMLSFSRQCAELMLAPSSASRETACVALTEMIKADLPAFVADTELIGVVAERCVELQGGKSSKVAAKAITLLSNIQAINSVAAVSAVETL